MRQLLIDFSSSPFMVSETGSEREPELAAIIEDEVTLPTDRAGGASVPILAQTKALVIPALRKNFPVIQNQQLRDYCWRTIFNRLGPYLKTTGPNGTALDDFIVHAVIPQTWRAIEADEFRMALRAHGIRAGQIASETVCLVCLIASDLHEFQAINAPDPLSLTVMVDDCDQSRCWRFNWYRACKPGVLFLTDYTPAWTHNAPPISSAADVLIVLSNPKKAEPVSPEVGSIYTVKRFCDFPLLQGGSLLLQRLAGHLRLEENLRVEMAPSLVWRWGQRSKVAVLSPDVLLSPSCFPLLVERQCSYRGGNDDWGSVTFWLEAAWGKVPESWSPLAAVQLRGSLLHGWKRAESQRNIKLKLQMAVPSCGKISLEVIEADGPTFHDCAEFKLGSALA